MKKINNKRRATENRVLTLLFCTAILPCFLFTAVPAFAQDDIVKLVEEKRIELQAKEDAMKKEADRLNALRKDVDEKIDRYTKLLNRLEAALKKAEQIHDERLLSVARLYEVMSAEEAASKLSTMDIDTVVRIMLRMKTKKAGAIVALLDAKKAVTITKNMASMQIKK